MPARKLKDFLDRNDIAYVMIAHSPAYTAQGIAQSAHVPGKELAKCVIIKVDGELAMAVLPATHKVDVDVCREAIGAKSVEIASEKEFSHTFPGCELGAMPPFGNLWDVPVYVAARLTEDETIVFNAGSHTELIRMHFADFQRLVQPKIVPLTGGVPV
ncbi:MAG: YbaK/EbsC family protein [Planctomycetes bacterium]|nr:YbaK/EbsC family protein [Planctomycetota bacterium]